MLLVFTFLVTNFSKVCNVFNFQIYMNIFKLILGSRNNRLIKKYKKQVAQINAYEPEYEKLSDADLAHKTEEFKARLKAGATLESLKIEAFATVKEASKRALSMRHYDVQLIGGLALCENKIAEMRTGEGKTLVATLAMYWAALAGKGAHLITVNDYLARRDAEWMGKLYKFLGLTIGVVVSDQDFEEKKQAYKSDITYGTNNEYGFDYLRDNSMVVTAESRVQRGLFFALIDEVDSVLIDEARTPLIISGPAEDKIDIYRTMFKITPKLEEQVGGKLEKSMIDRMNEKYEAELPGDYLVDEKNKQIHLTEAGHKKAEDLLENEGLIKKNTSLYDAENINLLQHLNASLRARILFEKNKDYIVEQGKVVIIDEFTGRKMEGRRWSDGLHQAIEAKEGLSIQQESQTMASITFQNFFRLYERLAGMTGTADTEAAEFLSTYNLEVLQIPTNKPRNRRDLADMIFLNIQGKFAAIIEDVKKITATGQPILIGTASIESSEALSAALKKDKIKHNVLNAKHHENEAGIIAEAGRPYKVTIATNMAGRGTDIVLGGNLEVEIADLEKEGADEAVIAEGKRQWQQRHRQVIEASGLCVIGTERHESRRIDNQLRGRSGRQGDPGVTRFYISLDDDLMRIFGSERIKNWMRKIGMKEDEAIENSMITKSIERSQRKVEEHNQAIRSQLLKFDNISSDQRAVYYKQRNEIIDANKVSDLVEDMRFSVVEFLVAEFIAEDNNEHWDLVGLENAVEDMFGIKLDLQAMLDKDLNLTPSSLIEQIVAITQKAYEDKFSGSELERFYEYEKRVLLGIMDVLWREHLSALDYLRKGIHLRGYAQKDPFNEFRTEAFHLFEKFLDSTRREVINHLSRVQVVREDDVDNMQKKQDDLNQQAKTLHQEYTDDSKQHESKVDVQTITREAPKVGRNSACPCGSGKKYKQCHGRL